LAVTPDGKQLLSGAKDGSVRLWDVESGDVVQSFNGGFCNAVAIAPDGSIAAHDTIAGVQFWEIETGKLLRMVYRGNPPLNALVFSPDGRHLVGGNDGGEIRAWETQSGREVYLFDGHTAGVRSLRFSPSGDYLFSGSDDRTIRIFRWSTGNEIDRIDFKTTCSQFLALSSDGGILASAGGMIVKQDASGRWIPIKDGDYAIRLWQVSEKKEAEHGPKVTGR
jgi:WD40 repeat protein